MMIKKQKQHFFHNEYEDFSKHLNESLNYFGETKCSRILIFIYLFIFIFFFFFFFFFFFLFIFFFFF